MISIQTNDRNGDAVGAILVQDSDEAMLITNGGTLVRTRVAEVSVIGRNTQGVKVIGVSEGEQLISVEKVAETNDDENEEDLQGTENSAEEGGNEEVVDSVEESDSDEQD